MADNWVNCCQKDLKMLLYQRKCFYFCFFLINIFIINFIVSNLHPHTVISEVYKYIDFLCVQETSYLGRFRLLID